MVTDVRAEDVVLEHRSYCSAKAHKKHFAGDVLGYITPVGQPGGWMADPEGRVAARVCILTSPGRSNPRERWGWCLPAKWRGWRQSSAAPEAGGPAEPRLQVVACPLAPAASRLTGPPLSASGTDTGTMSPRSSEASSPTSPPCGCS